MMPPVIQAAKKDTSNVISIVVVGLVLLGGLFLFIVINAFVPKTEWTPLGRGYELKVVRSAIPGPCGSGFVEIGLYYRNAKGERTCLCHEAGLSHFDEQNFFIYTCGSDMRVFIGRGED